MAKPSFMKKLWPLLLLGALSNLNGCARDRSLAPPADSELITIQVKLPPELEPETMRVMYRSADCQITRHYADGSPYQIDGHNSIDVQLQRQGQSDIYEGKPAKDGGGDCRWHLANVTIGVAYREPERFGEDVQVIPGSSPIIVIFDNNPSPRGDGDLIFNGEEIFIKDFYYPWVHENFAVQYIKYVNLVRSGSFYSIYTARNARSVSFEPVIYSDYVVYSVGPKHKDKGNRTIYRYPDGSLKTENRFGPDFRKLEAIRLGAEAKK